MLMDGLPGDLELKSRKIEKIEKNLSIPRNDLQAIENGGASPAWHPD